MQDDKAPVEALAKRLGFERLEALRRVDLTPELREKTQLTAEDESRLLAVAELHAQGLPLEVANAIVTGGAVGSAAELAALEAEEVRGILNEASVKRLLPESFQVNIELIEQWLQRIGPLTADDEGTTRDAVTEDKQQSLTRDEDKAIAMEDVLLSRNTINEILGALRESCRRGETSIEMLTRGSAEQIEASSVRETLVYLRDDIGNLVERFMPDEAGGLADINEDSGTAFEDEGVDPVTDVIALEAQRKSLELRLQSLRLLAETGHEERSPASEIEESKTSSEEEMKWE